MAFRLDLEVLFFVWIIFRDRLFPETNVRNIIFQLLQGLSYMHKLGKIARSIAIGRIGKFYFRI